MNIAIVCVPFSNDVARWGGARGPQALLDAGLVAALEGQGHQVDSPVWIEVQPGERTRDIVTNLGKIASRESDAVDEALRAGKEVIVLEGDCTHAPGAAGGLARAAGSAGVVWFDAHGDINTMATSLTGLWGGMPYAVIMGLDLDDWREAAGLREGVRPRAAALVGGSDLDDAEIAILDSEGIARLDADAMMTPGTGERLAALLRDRTGEANAWYFHLDLDVAGPEESPGGHTPALHWPPRDQLLEAAAATGATVHPRVIGLSAYNPDGDPEGRGAQFAIDMTLAALNAMNGGE